MILQSEWKIMVSKRIALIHFYRYFSGLFHYRSKMMNRTSDLSKHLGNVSSTHLCNNTTYNYTELYAGIFWGTVFMLAFVTTNTSYYLSLYISFFCHPFQTTVDQMGTVSTSLLRNAFKRLLVKHQSVVSIVQNNQSFSSYYKLRSLQLHYLC